MAEFPNLGKHCSVPECHMLDFLPIKCDACSAIVCRNHMTYETHRCTSGRRKDVQVPVCPLCSQPVPCSRTELPDVKVNEHIERDCESDPATKRRKQELQCSLNGCRKRELVRIYCEKCRRNFCLTHRHEDEHNCMGLRENPALKKRFFYESRQPLQNVPLTESDEALAKALHASINGPTAPQMDEDELSRQLARQLQEEEYRFSLLDVLTFARPIPLPRPATNNGVSSAEIDVKDQI